MIRAIAWKEWREQRAIALAVLTFGVLALALTSQFADPTTGGSAWSQAGPRELMAQALAYLAGTVCGAMLLADEKEIGTLEFLDTLPTTRRALWWGKVVFGLGLAFLQGAALAGLAIAFRCADPRVPAVAYAAVVILISLLAFAWGMFGGALARSTLGAVFQGSIGSVVAGLALAVVFVVLFGPRAFTRLVAPAAVAFFVAWLGSGLLASALVFTSVDRERRPVAAGAGAPARRARRPMRRLAGLRALVWLSARQVSYVALAMLAAAGVGGAVMLAPDAQPVFLWPTVTLAFGVLAGITTLAEEQARGVARFWAERRLPLGRLWLTKAGFHLALAAAAGLVLLIPLVAAHPAQPFHTRLLARENLREELPRFLLLSLVYGFAVGHLAGMLFRKAAVAGLVASVVSATMLALIYPSVIAGGAAAWQVWGPAVVLLLTARLLLYPWATERVTYRGPVLRAVGGTALAVGLLGAGLAYRVYEIPDVSDRLAESGFLASLPSFEENKGGQDVKSAVSQFRRAADSAEADYPRGRDPAAGRRPERFGADRQDPLDQVARAGWTEDSRALDKWLNSVFADGWDRFLDGLDGRPAGVFDDPRTRNWFTPQDAFADLYVMGVALRARGMQKLEAGDADTYARLLRGGLAAARSARDKGGWRLTAIALEMEEGLLRGLDEWLSRGFDKESGPVRERPDLLRAVAADLVRHDREMAVGWDDAYWAEQVVLRNTMDGIGSWLAPRRLSSRGGAASADPQADSEAEVVSFAWNVPWERARRERILRVHTHPEIDLRPDWLSELHLKRMWRPLPVDPERDLRAVTARRFAILKVALRLYQLEHGRPAPDLASLVPAYVPVLPLDPYTQAAFGYRLSDGEPQPPPPRRGPPRPIRLGPDGIPGDLEPVGLKAEPGDPIVWSTGPDRRDDGGRRPLTSLMPTDWGEDWIVVIPTPARRRERDPKAKPFPE